MLPGTGSDDKCPICCCSVIGIRYGAPTAILLSCSLFLYCHTPTPIPTAINTATEIPTPNPMASALEEDAVLWLLLVLFVVSLHRPLAKSKV